MATKRIIINCWILAMPYDLCRFILINDSAVENGLCYVQSLRLCMYFMRVQMPHCRYYIE